MAERMLTVQQYADKRGITEGRVRQLLLEKRIPGVKRFGRAWMIPAAAAIKDPVQPRGRPRKAAKRGA